MLSLSILYRGPLAECNYACGYCPFPRGSTAADHAADKASLQRFVDWAAGRSDDCIAVFFTPAGEALTHPWYQGAIARLTQLPGIVKVAAQTNLSCRLDWVQSCRTAKLALWCTYHPQHVGRETFLEQCRTLDRLGVRYSVGMVGLRQHVTEAEQIRSLLPPQVYLWINAFKHEPDYYTPDMVRRLTAVDPLFPFSLCAHASLNRTCRTGQDVIAVDGDGTIRRCHFVAEPLGNLYQEGWDKVLRPRPCPNTECRCHIGYVHLAHLGLRDVFKEGVLERATAYVSTMGR